MTMRILVTGSRNHRSLALVRHALTDGVGFGRWASTPPPGWRALYTVVHGGARGADKLADIVARQNGMTLDVHEAPWRAACRPVGDLDPLNNTPWCPPGHRKVRDDGTDYCPSMGKRRNQHMVELGADICLAFPLGASRGTRDCMRRAEAAGIEVRVHEQVRTP